MTAKTILQEIAAVGKDSYRRILFTHGVKDPCYGVKIGDLKKIQKRIKTNYQLALDLYDTGNYDAMYLAGLIADDKQMTRRDLQNWVEKAYCGPLAGWTVAVVAAGSPDGYEMALEWTESDNQLTAVAGWATLSCLVSVKNDEELDLKKLESLLKHIEKTIHRQPDPVRYQMNAFVISLGSFVKKLSRKALASAEKIGHVTADIGDNNCQVPFAPDYIRKVEQRGAIGKKRKTVKC